MREIDTVAGQRLTTGCIGCAIASDQIDHPGKIYRSAHFDAHQDIEIALPGFVIVSTLRHIASVREFSAGEEQEFAAVIARVREAQHRCGFDTVYLFQNEDTLDHFHLWMFPVYEWMRVFGKGATLLSHAMSELKQGRHCHDRQEVFAMLASLKTHVVSSHA